MSDVCISFHTIWVGFFFKLPGIFSEYLHIYMYICINKQFCMGNRKKATMRGQGFFLNINYGIKSTKVVQPVYKVSARKLEVCT